MTMSTTGLGRPDHARVFGRVWGRGSLELPFSADALMALQASGQCGYGCDDCPLLPSAPTSTQPDHAGGRTSNTCWRGPTLEPTTPRGSLCATHFLHLETLPRNQGAYQAHRKIIHERDILPTYFLCVCVRVCVQTSM